MNIINIKDIVEDNGKTVEENNLAVGHNIPIGTVVEFEFETCHHHDSEIHGGDGLFSKGIKRLVVCEHNRDCDGSPLYAMACCANPGEQLDDFFSAIGAANPQGFLRNNLLESMYQYTSGYPEEALTVIDVIPWSKDPRNKSHH